MNSVSGITDIVDLFVMVVQEQAGAAAALIRGRTTN